MNILLSNDDGYQAPGLRALHAALSATEGVRVHVIAPERNNSAKSNALSVHEPLSVHTADNGFQFVTGTPADCVHLALTGLLDWRPDLVVSGINNGANMGDDTLYSGTVGAAMEGYLFGIAALAFSQVKKGWAHLDDAALVARDIVLGMARAARPDAPWLLNVNIPNLPRQSLKAPRICRLGRRHAAQPAHRMQGPDGQMLYWIGASGPARDSSEGTDFAATAAGHVAITPLQIDLTDHEALAWWQQGLPQLLPTPPAPAAAQACA